MKRYYEVTKINGIDDYLSIINLLIKVEKFYGAVFASEDFGSLQFTKYSIVLINTEDDSSFIKIDLVGNRDNKKEPFSYDFRISDSNIFKDSSIKIGRTIFDPVYNIFTSFNELSINEFIKLSKRVLAKHFRLNSNWQIISIPEFLLQNFYSKHIVRNPNLDIMDVIDYFDSRFEIISAINFNKTELHLSNKFWDELPDEIWQLKHLLILTIERTGIYNLPDDIKCLPLLNELIIANNRHFGKISSEIYNLKELTHLYLHENNIYFLPESIGELNNLRILNLSFNYLKALPESITTLSNLELLNVSYNPIVSLPEGIYEMLNLRELNISHCFNLDLDYIHQKLINNNKIKIYS